eukprot:4090540-Pleurochrysis_carterae.AAC.5
MHCRYLIIDRADRHRQRWRYAHGHGSGTTAGINVADYVLVRYGSADFAKNRRKHGFPTLRRFRVVRVLPAAGAVQIDPAGTGNQPHGGEPDGQVDDEDDVYIVEQIDAARQRKGHWEYRVIWEGYPDPTWETDVTLSTTGEQVQAMMREARIRAEGEQKGTRKAARVHKAGVNLFTALEPPLGSNPIFRMRQEAFGPNELENCGCAYLPLYFYGTF